jgi:hypothetical protein
MREHGAVRFADLALSTADDPLLTDSAHLAGCGAGPALRVVKPIEAAAPDFVPHQTRELVGRPVHSAPADRRIYPAVRGASESPPTVQEATAAADEIPRVSQELLVLETAGP